MFEGFELFRDHLVVEERIEGEVLVPDCPQYSGALGAALFAMEGGI